MWVDRRDDAAAGRRGGSGPNGSAGSAASASQPRDVQGLRLRVGHRPGHRASGERATLATVPRQANPAPLAGESIRLGEAAAPR